MVSSAMSRLAAVLLLTAPFASSRMAFREEPASLSPHGEPSDWLSPPIDLTGVDVRGPAEGIITHTNDPALSAGGYLLGEVAATFKEMLDTFGVPMNGGDEEKISATWNVRFADGTQAQLYDWKATRRYYHDDRFPTVEEFLDVTSDRKISWHVGGTDPRAVGLVSAAVDATRAAGDAK